MRHILIWKGTQHKTRPGDFDTNQWGSFLGSKKKAFDAVDHQLFLTKFSAIYRNSGPSLICSYVTRRLVSPLYRS